MHVWTKGLRKFVLRQENIFAGKTKKMLSVRRLKPLLVALSLLIIAYNLMPDMAPMDIRHEKAIAQGFHVVSEDDAHSDLSADKQHDLIQRLRNGLESQPKISLPATRSSNMSAINVTQIVGGLSKQTLPIDEDLPQKAEGDSNTERKGNQTSRQIRLILLAYMRTGSSMTGAIIKHHRSVFYWYEPLHALESYFTTRGHLDNTPTNYRTAREEFTNSDMAVGNISSILKCDIDRLYRDILLDGFLSFSKVTSQHINCFKAADPASSWNSCAHDMSATCKKDYSVVAVKTIRFHMTRALALVQSDPDVKIVHLVRDPRAVLLSRRKLGFCNWTDLANEASHLCSRMYRDLKLTLAAKDTLKGRYLLKRYEDTASSPVEAMDLLYSFVGLVSSAEDQAFAKNLTESAKKIKPCPKCKRVVYKSREISQAWRKSITHKDAQTISRQCRDVMELLGYRKDFASKKVLRNLAVSAVQKPHRSVERFMDIF